MLPDGIFDGALTYQSINCFVSNTADQDLSNVDLYLEGIGDPGIIPEVQIIKIPVLRAGETRLCSWPCDFSQSTPGKTLVSIRAQRLGFTPARILKRIFVSRTLYDWGPREYVCRIPEGTLRLKVNETSGRPIEYIPGPEPEKKLTAGPWIIRRFSAEVSIDFQGQYGPLAFGDPWWKVVAWIIAAIAGIAAIILAKEGKGTASVKIVCDYDEKTGQRSCRMPDPEPTTGPTETSPASVANAIASTAVSVGLRDEIDPWRRGQEATPVPQNERTLSEKLDVSLTPLGTLEAGQPYTIRCNWLYTRTTDRGVYHASSIDDRTNQHLSSSKRLIAPQRVHVSQTIVPVSATFDRGDGTPYKGTELFVTFIARPPAGQGGEFRTILVDPDGSGEFRGDFPLGVAIGQLRERHENFIGIWRLYIVAQDVNLGDEHLSPEDAARIIGGFPISGFTALTLDPSPCPVFGADALMEVYE